MSPISQDEIAATKLRAVSRESGIDLSGCRVRRTSSRICLGVEHGDYNGTELFGVGVDRFIWIAYSASGTRRMRLFSEAFRQDGVIEFALGQHPEPKSKSIADTWARFPYGIDYVLKREGIRLSQGINAVIHGDIPGGGMSRSASLTLNLMLCLLDANNVEVTDPFKIVDLAQAVENDYIGSPCGKLDQVIILFAREAMGAHYSPKSRSVRQVAFGKCAEDFRIVVLDTGTVRSGLENSTYTTRRAECEQLVALCQHEGFDLSRLADIRDEATYDQIIAQFGEEHPDLCRRLNYVYHAQQRFYEMLGAWESGDIETVGRVFRHDGIGLRDDYDISGPELETMCDIARTVPGVLGERMLGGGDKGAVGVIVRAGQVDALRQAVDLAYPRSHPAYADRYAVHVCKMVEGVHLLDRMPSAEN